MPIIPRSESWKHALQRSIRDPAELLRRLQLPPSLLAGAERAAATFPLRVPVGYLNRMEVGNPDDPLLRQVLPLAEELRDLPGYSLDPVGDLAASKAPGVLQKYQGRLLLVTTAACAVNCRFCFRRHFPYQEENPSVDQWQEALTLLEQDPTISEVILSGGDPLLLDDARLRTLLQRLEAVPHLKRVRFHSRLPIVLPERVTRDLLELFTKSRLQTIVVIHCNHPNELADDVILTLRRLAAAGVQLLNQSVLLRGVNDQEEVLVQLSEQLFAAGVLPYYLHLLDRVTGAAHFESDAARLQPLLHGLRTRLPGYLMPRVVREQAGAAYKQPVGI